MTLFKSLSPNFWEYFNSFPLVATFLIKAPVPPITPVRRAPSVPNLILFNISLTACSFPPSSDSVSRAVGPPNKSPMVPKSSTSATKTPSAIPPATAPAAYFMVLPLAFNSNASCPALARVLLLRLKYFPLLADCIALMAAFAPYLYAIPPGTPMLTSAAAILPAVVDSAFSSKFPKFL